MYRQGYVTIHVRPTVTILDRVVRMLDVWLICPVVSGLSERGLSEVFVRTAQGLSNMFNQ